MTPHKKIEVIISTDYVFTIKRKWSNIRLTFIYSKKKSESYNALDDLSLIKYYSRDQYALPKTLMNETLFHISYLSKGVELVSGSDGY